MSYAIIQGGSKGIGFALARILHSRTTLNVLVTSRSKEIFDTSMASSGISDDRIKHLPMDITNSDSVKAAFASVKEDYGRNLALYVNSAGYLEPEKSLGQLSDYERINRHFAVNVMGPMHAASFFSKLYPSKPDPLSIFPPAWLNITARVGSISENKMGGWYSYRCSKSAMNQFTKTMAVEMARSNVRVLSMHPGTVDTDLSRPFVSKAYKNRVLSADEAAECIWKKGIIGATDETGVFIDWEGKHVEW